MRYVVVLLIFVASSAAANWRPEAEATIEQGDVAADANATSNSEGGDVGDVTNNNSTEIINPDDIKLRNTPSFGMGAAKGNAGISFAIPGFGFGVNAPVQKEDEKKLAIIQQLWEMEAYGAARRVACTMYRLEKAFKEMPPEVDCFTSLGGDSVPEGK